MKLKKLLPLLTAMICLTQILAVPVPPAAAQPPTIGVNLNSQEALFADAMRFSRPHWATTTDLYNFGASEDANGWPTEDASIVVWEGRSGNEGTYALSFNGKAHVETAFGYGTLSPQNSDGTTGTYNSATNTTSATMTVIPGFQNFSLIFTSTHRTAASPTNTGVTNVRLYRPTFIGSTTSYAPGTIFPNEYTNLAAKFSTLRLMDYGDTNSTAQSNWSDRKLPTAEIQTQPVAWEYLVQLSNFTGKDIYIDIPILATNDYITKLAQLFKYGSDGVNPYTSTQANPVYPPLNVGRHVYIEYSNEVWNFGAGAFPKLLAKVQSDIAAKNAEYYQINYDGVDTSGPDSGGNYNNQFLLMWRLTAERIRATSDIFRSVYGDAAMPPNANPTVRPVLEWQYDNSNDIANAELGYLDNFYSNGDGQSHVASPHPVYYFLWGGGGASYYGSNNDDATTIDGIFNSGIPSTGFEQTIQGEALWGKVFGLKTIAYEGGWAVQHSGGNGYQNPVGSPSSEAKYDPRAQQAEFDSETIFSRQGGDLNMFFTASSPNREIVWGMTDNIQNLTDPIYKAIDQINATNQAAPTGGSLVPADVPAGAYHDTLSHDVTSTNVQYVRPGWVENYMIRAATAGSYTLKISFDGSPSNLMPVIVNGDTVTRSLAMNGIGYGQQNAVDSAAVTIHLNAGINGIRLQLISGDTNLHLIRISSGSSTTPTAATPTFSPAGGSFTTAQSVTISDSTGGAAIHYTTDGSTPTAASPTYSGAINVSATTTINAIATASGYAASTVATATYTISTGGGTLIDRTNETGGLIQARGDNAPNEGKAQAFDNNTNTKWLDFSSSSWISYQFANNAAYVITEYKVTSGNDTATYLGRAPNSWVLKGSNDGTTWTTLDTRTNVADTANLDTKVYDFSNSTAYKIYKLDNIVSSGDNTLQLSEIRLLGPAGGSGGGSGGTLTGSGRTFTTATTVNLTTTGPTDWIHWGLSGTGLDHKATGGGAISSYSTVVPSATVRHYSDNLVGFTWTDGTPTSAATATTTGVYTGGQNNGFSFTLPASTTAQTLTVYVGGAYSDGKLTAHLSDGSAPDYVDSSYGFDKTGNTDGAHYCAAYTLTFSAASTGKQLKVSWVQTTSGGNVTLQAAASPPAANRPAVPGGVSATAGAAGSKAITVKWSAVTGATSYTVYRASSSTGTYSQVGTSSSASFTNTGLTVGTTYYYKVAALNQFGVSSLSAAVSAKAQ